MTDEKKSDIGTDITLVGNEHVRRYLETNGEVGHIWNGVTALLLTTVGRKSGEERITPLIYASFGDAYVIIASMGGAPKHPAWYLNIVENPNVTVQVKGDRFKAVAHVAEGEERERGWAAATAIWPNYDVYQSRTDRKIPVVVLKRA